MKIEESLQHFRSFNKQEKYYFCEFYLHLYVHIFLWISENYYSNSMVLFSNENYGINIF